MKNADAEVPLVQMQGDQLMNTEVCEVARHCSVRLSVEAALDKQRGRFERRDGGSRGENMTGEPRRLEALRNFPLAQFCGSNGPQPLPSPPPLERMAFYALGMPRGTMCPGAEDPLSLPRTAKRALKNASTKARDPEKTPPNKGGRLGLTRFWPLSLPTVVLAASDCISVATQNRIPRLTLATL